MAKFSSKSSTCPHSSGKIKGTTKYAEQEGVFQKSPDIWDSNPIQLVMGGRMGKSEIEFMAARFSRSGECSGRNLRRKNNGNLGRKNKSITAKIYN